MSTAVVSDCKFCIKIYLFGLDKTVYFDSDALQHPKQDILKQSVVAEKRVPCTVVLAT